MAVTKDFSRKLTMIIVLAFAFITVLSYQIPAYAKDTVPVIRLSGADRYQTAAAISKEGWIYSDSVVLAAAEGDDSFADALSGSPLSYLLNAPTLLTAANELSTSTREEIIRLNAKSAILLGGRGVISEKVENELMSMGLSVQRIWGPDRYSTAFGIAEKIRETIPFTKVFLTTGEKFQYAMMIGPYASKNNIPILFSEKDELKPELKTALTAWGILEVDIIGNTDIISQPVEDNLRDMGIDVKRVQGADIGDTNINVINTYKMESDSIAAARDDLFADGLAGIPFAAIKNMPVILTGQSSASASISNFLIGNDFEYAYIIGGFGAVSDYIIPLLRKGNSHEFIPGNTPGNINNGGLSIENSGWIFYHNPYVGGELCKIKTDNTEKTQVSIDIPMNINAAGGWLYYTNLSDGSKIYKLKGDGTCRTRLNDDISWNIEVIDNWIYYINRSDNNHLYKISTDGTWRTRLNEDNCRFIAAGNDWIYYVNEDDTDLIYRIKPDTPYSVQKLKGVHAGSMDISNGYIYFANEKDGKSLYKIDLNGTVMTKLTGDTVYNIQVLDDYVYYSNGSDENKLYKIKTDGTERTIVHNGSAYLINIVDNWIYFVPDESGLSLYKVRTDGTGLSEVN